jgi:tetraacyldisaccharide 4'-kinase
MLELLSRLYGMAVARRNRRYDLHQLPIVPVDRPVISVGNISAGGTGKTPVTQMLVHLLREAGRRPAIVMRGYKRRSRGLLVVHDGKELVANVSQAGDEAFLHASTLDVPVVVSSDKVEAAAYAAGHLPCDVIIVDDGFQHRALHRDVDIVIVDRETIAGRLLPAGRLREPLSSLGRADVVLLSGDVLPSEIEPHLRSTARLFSLERLFTCGASTEIPVVAVSGIARPDRFHTALRDRGYHVVEEITYADHHRYTAFNASSITQAAARHSAQVITTSKDHVKLAPLLKEHGADIQLSVLDLKMQVHSSSSFLSALLPRITP